jgi:dipeptidyl aminopeptidase/acylaminoacyl peptidase
MRAIDGSRLRCMMQRSSRGISMLRFWAAAAITAAAGSTQAAPALEDYGRLPGVEQMTLSPSGEQVAMIAVLGEKRRVVVIATDGKVRLAVPVGSLKVRDLNWAGEDHLLVVNSQMLNAPDLWAAKYEFSTEINVDLTGKKAAAIFAGKSDVYPAVMRDYGARLLDGRWYGFFGAVTLDGRPDERYLGHAYADLYKVDLQTGSARKTATGSENEHDWAVAGDGSIAARSEYNRETGRWRLVTGDFGGRELMDLKSPFDDIDLKGLGRTPDTVLVVDATGEQTVTEEQPLDGGAATPLFADKQLRGYIYAGKSRLLLGATVEGPEGAVLFDPHLQARLRGARKALAGYQIQLVSYTDDFGRMILHTDGGDDSGTYWFVDITAGKANPIGQAYPTITSKDVGPTRLISYKAADGMELDGVLTLPPGREAKNLPVVVMPHGGPIGPYDEVGFDWWAQAFASRGYAVLQPNFRGSGGHGRAYHDAGFGEWGRKMQTDVSDGLAAVAAQGIVDPKRACIVGGSYGGYAALAGVTLQHGLYRCAVSYAGVSDIGAMLYSEGKSSGQRSDTVRFWRAAIGVKGAGDPMADKLSPARHAGEADAPILLIHGKEDTVVDPNQTAIMAAALKRADKPVEVMTLPAEDHWMSREETRIATLKASVAFVERHNPAN